jgi:hypothetical protein
VVVVEPATGGLVTTTGADASGDVLSRFER